MKELYATKCIGNVDTNKLVSTKSGNIPLGSVYGGFDRGRSMFLCLASTKDGEVIGKLAETLSVCFYPLNGQEFNVEEYKVVTYVDGVWVPIANSEFPCNIIQFSEFLKKPVFAGRMHIDNTLTIGSVIDGKAYIPYNGGVQSPNNYEMYTGVSMKLEVNNGSSKRFVTQGKYLVFKVRAEDEVAIYLGVRKVNHFVITLGAKDSIGLGSTFNPFYTNTKADSGLNENVFKGYWIRWTVSNFLEFGREGDIVPILTLKDDNAFKIDSVVFVSPNKNSEWILPELEN